MTPSTIHHLYSWQSEVSSSSSSVSLATQTLSAPSPMRRIASFSHPSVPFIESINLISNHKGSQRNLNEKLITYFKSIPMLKLMVNEFFDRPENDQKRRILQCGKITWHDLKTNRNLRGNFPLESIRDEFNEITFPDHSWEGFRREVEELFSYCSNLILKHLSVTPVKTVAAGTIGVQADVDLTFLQHNKPGFQKHTEEELFLAKMLFDTLFGNTFFHLSGPLFSGPLFDLETYTSHPGERRIFERIVQRGAPEKVKQKYAYIEKFLVILQAALNLSPEVWQYMQKHFIDSSMSQKYTIKGMIEECNTFMHLVRTGENREIMLGVFEEKVRANNPELTSHEARLLAEESFSKEGFHANDAKLEQDAAKVRAEESIQADSYRHSYTMPILMRISHELTGLDHKLESKRYLKSRDDDEIALLLRLGLRGTQFPESYFTNGAYNVVCADRGGQVESMHKLLSQYALKKTGTFINPTRLRVRRSSEPHVNDILNDIQHNMAFLYGADTLSLPPLPAYEGHDFPYIQEHVECLDENCVLFAHKYHLEHKNGESKVDALITASKYEERTMTSLIKALEECMKYLRKNIKQVFFKDKILQVVLLLEKACEANDRAKDLLKCKRKVAIAKSTEKPLLEVYHRDFEVNIQNHIELLLLPEELNTWEEVHNNFLQEISIFLEKNRYEKRIVDACLAQIEVKDSGDRKSDWQQLKEKTTKLLFPSLSNQNNKPFASTMVHVIEEMKNKEKDPAFQIRNLEDKGSISGFTPEDQLYELQTQVRPYCHPQLLAILHGIFGVPSAHHEMAYIHEFNKKHVLMTYHLTEERLVEAHVAEFNALVQEGLICIESLGVIPRLYENGRQELAPVKVWKEFEKPFRLVFEHHPHT